MNYEIKPSNINGFGVFALENIKKGTKIADYVGIEMSYKDFKEKYGGYKSNSLHTYPMRRISKIIVAKEEPYKSENIVNFINEATDANVILKKRALYAKQEIKINEEFLLNYPKDYNRDYILNQR
jgi:SET domain-containing protein